MNAERLAALLEQHHTTFNDSAAKMLRRQHEAIRVLRAALEASVAADDQAILDAETFCIPFPEEMLSEYRKAKQALKNTEEMK